MVALALAHGCDSGPLVADDQELQAALAGARVGDVVRLGPGTFTAPIVVPEGVWLVGSGPGRSQIVGAVPRQAIEAKFKQHVA